MISPLLFVTCFMFLASLLLIGVIYSRVHWLLKSGLVVASLAFSVLFYHGYVDSLGFPVDVRPAGVFRFIYGIVREPMLIEHDPGAIFMWITTDGSRQPRAIVLPYSKENRKFVTTAKKRVEGGEYVYMAFGQKPNGQTTHAEEGNQGNSGGRNKSTSGSNNVPYEVHGDDDLNFKEMPDTAPKKETQ